jgi:predicted kinase
MGQLIYINGAPGVGKLTIARLMAEHLNARVLDNHTIYNVGFALTDFRSAAFYAAVRAVRTAAYDQILSLPGHEIVILTAADFDDSDWGRENWQAVTQLAGERQWPFYVITLTCEPDEHRRRIISEDREGRGKLRDADAVIRLSQRPLIQGRGDRKVTLDTTNMTATDASEHLLIWMGAR